MAISPSSSALSDQALQIAMRQALQAGTAPRTQQGEAAPGTQAPNPADQAQAAPSPEAVQQALAEVNATISRVAPSLQFSLDQDTGKTVIKVMDTANDQVIRQIPSEELLAISRAMSKLQGLLVKQTA